MDLKLSEVAKMLRVNEKTVLSWIKERKVRAFKVYNQYRFNRDELNEWILKGKIPVPNEVLQLVQSSVPVNMYKLFERGGVYYHIDGNTVSEVMRNAVMAIPAAGDDDKERLLAALLEREEMMTTGLGEGIALPHPRSPIIAEVDQESVSICFLEKPVDFNAIDGKPVHTLCIIMSANARRHLEILSKISYLCRDLSFTRMLAERATPEEILQQIRFCEHEWSRKKP